MVSVRVCNATQRASPVPSFIIVGSSLASTTTDLVHLSLLLFLSTPLSPIPPVCFSSIITLPSSSVHHERLHSHWKWDAGDDSEPWQAEQQLPPTATANTATSRSDDGPSAHKQQHPPPPTAAAAPHDTEQWRSADSGEHLHTGVQHLPRTRQSTAASAAAVPADDGHRRWSADLLQPPSSSKRRRAQAADGLCRHWPQVTGRPADHRAQSVLSVLLLLSGTSLVHLL